MRDDTAVGRESEVMVLVSDADIRLQKRSNDMVNSLLSIAGKGALRV